jgi:hypothetical protein
MQKKEYACILFLKIPNMPSFGASFAFSFSFSDLSLEELGLCFLESSWFQACIALSSSSMDYLMDEEDPKIL